MSTSETVSRWIVRKRWPQPGREEFVVVLQELQEGRQRLTAQAGTAPTRQRAEAVAERLNAVDEVLVELPPVHEGMFLDPQARDWLMWSVADDGMRPGYTHPVIDPQIAARVLLYITECERLLVSHGVKVWSKAPTKETRPA